MQHWHTSQPTVQTCVKITDDGIKDIVEKIGNKLKTLSYCDCNRCTNTALQSIVDHCPNLVELHAGYAGISKIPHNIGQRLTKLEALYLSFNDIKTLPPSIALLYEKDDADLQVVPNPLEDPPLHIVEEGTKAISKYFLHQYIDTLQSDTAEPAENSNAVPADVPLSPQVVTEVIPEPVPGQQSSSQDREKKFVLEIDPGDLSGVAVRVTISKV
jgi:Leucine-rich repeat (LRR) protein